MQIFALVDNVIKEAILKCADNFKGIVGIVGGVGTALLTAWMI